MDIIERISAIAKLTSGIEDHKVYDQLGDLRISAYELKNEIIKLRSENTELKQKLLDENNKTLKNECYYFKEDGPYCTRCYDVDGKKVHMFVSDNHLGSKYYTCPNCKHEILKEKYDLNFGGF